MDNIIEHSYYVTQTHRNKLNAHKSLVIWFTGLSGSGKSTIANLLEKKLHERSILTYSLDGDNVRAGLNKELSFSSVDRTENIRRIAEVAKLFVDAGVVVISAFISPLKEDREMARMIVGKKDFFEIYVNTPLEVCEERDVKGLYKKARTGEIQKFTGITAPYEAPENPNLEIDTTKVSVEDAVEKVYNFLLNKLQLK